MDTTVTRIGAVVVSELCRAGYMNSTVWVLLNRDTRWSIPNESLCGPEIVVAWF